MDETLAAEVRHRAHDCCEYCRMPQLYYPTVTFPTDHVIARQHGDKTTLGNLALSGLHCNLHKGTESDRDRPGDPKDHPPVQPSAAQMGSALSVARRDLGGAHGHRPRDDRCRRTARRISFGT